MDGPPRLLSGHIDVGDGQQVYWEEVGEADGRPALWLHGGPGSGISPGQRRIVSRPGWRGVLFDQRGAGRSSPSAADPSTDLSVNTTPHLVADIERLREHRGIDSWVVVGGSWGCTLALAYAIAHPSRVDGLCLMSVTTGDPGEVEWITRTVGRVFPEAWDEFVSHLPEDRRGGSLAAAYARLLESDDARVRAEAARAWCAWEEAHVSLAPGWQPSERFQDPEFAYAFARLVTHYWAHDCFLPAGHVRRHAPLLDCPVELIHGRYDVSGPVGIAWDLARLLPQSTLTVVGDAGHSGPQFAEAEAAAMGRLLAAPSARPGP